MKQWKNETGGIDYCEGKTDNHPVHGSHDVPVREHNTLGKACGAPGVHQDGQIIFIHFHHGFFCRGIPEEVFIGHKSIIFFIQGYPMSDVFQILLEPEGPFFVSVSGKIDGGLTVVGNIIDLLVGQPEIKGRNARPQAWPRQSKSPYIYRYSRPEYGNAAAFFQSKSDQDIGQPIDPFVQFLIGEILGLQIPGPPYPDTGPVLSVVYLPKCTLGHFLP